LCAVNYTVREGGALAAIIPPTDPQAQAALIHTCKYRV